MTEQSNSYHTDTRTPTRALEWGEMRVRTNGLILVLALAGCVADERGLDPSPHGTTRQSLGCADEVLLEMEGPVLWRTEADGSRRELFQIGASTGLASEETVVEQWTTAGRFVALVGFLYAPPSANRYEYVVVDTDGDVLLQRIDEEPYNPQVYLSPDGTLAVAAGHGFIAHPDGAVTDLGVYRPLVPVVDGRVLVAAGEPWRPGVTVGWMDVETQTFAPLAEVPAGYAAYTPLPSGVLYPSESGELVLASPTGAQVIDAGGTSYPIDSTADGRYVLLVSSDGEQVLRLDTETLRATAIAGREPWARYEATLAPDGDVLATFGLEDGRLQLRRTADLGATWSDVGEAMTPRQDFGAGNHLLPFAGGDRILILNLSRGYGDFLDEIQLVGDESRTLTVGGVYVNGDLHPGAADLSADGACTATWIQKAGDVFGADEKLELVMLDSVTGREQSLRTTSSLSLLRFAR